MISSDKDSKISQSKDEIYDVIDIPESIRADFEKWKSFLEENIKFWLKDSEKHTKEHCIRVLLFSLLIAEKRNLSQEDKNVLCMASVFHDSRRQDDWYDVGHGQRAADYYKQYCKESKLPFDWRCYDVMYYHDRDDEMGKQEMGRRGTERENGILLYQIFKDADALDRFRLGPDGLDVCYLRTEEAKSLYDYAKNLWEQYFSEGTLKGGGACAS